MPPLADYLFDLDGTLIDSIELIIASYRHALAAHGLPVPPDHVILEGVGRPLRAHLEELCGSAPFSESLLDCYRTHNIENHDAMVCAFEGMRDVLVALRARGKRLGIVSSKSRAGVERGLVRCSMTGLFEVVITADDVTRHKPHPEPVLRALEALGGRPEAAVFIGDSPHDLASGRAAGVRTAAALWGPFSRSVLEAHAPDHWLSHPSEVLKIEPLC